MVIVNVLIVVILAIGVAVLVMCVMMGSTGKVASLSRLAIQHRAFKVNVMKKCAVSVLLTKHMDTGMVHLAPIVEQITMEVNARHSAIRLFVSMAAVL